jgi:hypothetical protein
VRRGLPELHHYLRQARHLRLRQAPRRPLIPRKSGAFPSAGTPSAPSSSIPPSASAPAWSSRSSSPTSWSCSSRGRPQPCRARHRHLTRIRLANVPKGLHPKALGCEERATQGRAENESPTPKALRMFSPRRSLAPSPRHNLLEVESHAGFPRGSLLRRQPRASGWSPVGTRNCPGIRQLPSATCPPPIHHLPRPPSTIHHPPSTIHHPPSTICHLPSAICHLPSAICHRAPRPPEKP